MSVYLFQGGFLKSQESKTRVTVFCDIIFDCQIIKPGDTLTGNVQISSAVQGSYAVDQILMEVTKVQRPSGLTILAHVWKYVKVHGNAECNWEFDKHLLKPPWIYRKGKVFRGRQRFFVSRHTLAGGLGGPIVITNLPLTIPFKTSLPEHLPATWTGSHGTIHYTANVFINKKKRPMQTFVEEIHVEAYRNLKLEQNLLCEARRDIQRAFRYAVIDLGNVEVSIWLPHCGIAAGQSIPLLCTINNESSIHFGGLIFVLTQLQIYRSNEPTAATRTYRKDICRVPRMVDILHGKYEYYCVLETDADIVPTNQFWRCGCCQLIYEVWASLQGAIPRYHAYGYPNIDTPGIPLIIGTEPLYEWDSKKVTKNVMTAVYETRPPIVMEPLPPDDDIEEMLNCADEDMDPVTENNLARQLVDEPMFPLGYEEEDDEENEDKPKRKEEPPTDTEK